MAEPPAKSPHLDGRPADPDRQDDLVLRPRELGDFVGQSAIVENLRTFVTAARERAEALDHVLLYGPPGLGKTTLAAIIAREMGSNLRATSGPVIERKDDLAAILTDLKRGDVLFIDEIHRLNRIVEECLYPALEDRKIDIMIGEGPHAKSIKLDIEPFTLVGATTRAGMVTGPLRTRFGMTFRLNYYSLEEMSAIVERSARLLGARIDPEGVRVVAGRSRGTPRIANRLLRRVRDIAQVRRAPGIDAEIAEQAMAILDVDGAGLDAQDRAFLAALLDKFGGGPVGLNTLAVALSEDEDTLLDMVEPYLIQLGFLVRTPRGRQALPAAYAHLGRPAPREAAISRVEADLFDN
ncbi:MAG: Holliday junction branch migration DNA helicase RuvB [Candidatus Sumerlaeia bacterium]|nr:Holliday junction branch migration DNA helicase RuvB [Candidatus Sumerlaeia bacterium]